MELTICSNADAAVRRLSNNRFHLETIEFALHLVCDETGEKVQLLQPVAELNGLSGAFCREEFTRVRNLSNRERKVLALLGDGIDMRGIAAALNLSVKTIETYRARLKQKLKIKERLRLIAFAVQCRLEHGKLLEDLIPPALLPSNDNGKAGVDSI